MTIPTPDKLRAISKSLATLDAIIMQDWELRYFSYNSRWSTLHEMASMRNGSGDHYFVLFTPQGCVGKGFCKGTIVAQKTAYDGLPQVFEKPFLAEPAFMTSDVSIAFWRLQHDQDWTWKPRGALEQGCADMLLGTTIGGPEKYQIWAKDYYEHDIPISAIRAIYDHIPLNAKILAELNPVADKAKLISDLEEIAYLNELQ